MAMNPMQRKANNSFLLGILVTLLITGCIIAFLIIQLGNVNKQKKQEEEESATVYVLTEDVKSGEPITTDKLQTLVVKKSMIPSNAISASQLDERMNQSDEESGLLIKKVEMLAKIDLKKSTVITSDMLIEGDQKNTASLRRQEYNMILLPTQIEANDYIDVRLRLPSGQDYIVVSKKRVEIPQIDGVDSANTIWINMTEEETLAMSNAIVEAYYIKGAVLYTSKYVEPGMQDTAVSTYVPNNEVMKLMEQDPNILQEARTKLFERYQQLGDTIRNNGVNPQLSQNAEDGQENVEAAIAEEIARAQEERQKYLEAIAGY